MTLNPSVTDDQLGQYTRKMIAIAGRLGKSLLFEEVMSRLQLIHDGQLGDSGVTQAMEPKPRSLLRLIQSDLVIPATDGTENLSDSEVFSGWIDPDLANWGCNVVSENRPETKAALYELTKNATFRQMFEGQGVDLDQLCLTPHQIKQFVLTHRDHLHPQGCATFFLFKVGDNFFVARVRWFVGRRLGVGVNLFSNAYVWGAGRRLRVVLPQLALKPSA